MRLLIMFLSFFGFAFATSQIESPHFIVLYDDSELAQYAQNVAADAEMALEVLSQIFSSPKDKIIIRFDTTTDSFNASASPIPRSTMVYRTVISGRFTSLYTVIIHELTHIKQLNFTEGVNGDAGLLFGLDLGLVYRDIPALPPAWFIEGIATWVESHYGINGRLYATETTQIIDSLVLSDNWPSLDDLSLANLENWPAGSARYYLGVRFIEYLVEKHSFEEIVELLKNYNSSYYKDSFSQNWQKVTGSSLFEDYADWTELTKENALKRKGQSQEEIQLTNTGWYKSALAISPDGTRIVYSYYNRDFKESKLILANYDGKKIFNERILGSIYPRDIAWLDDDTLIYNRFFRYFDENDYLDLFSFDLSSNTETRLTHQARAQFPKTHANCIYYVQNLVTTGSSLKKYCQGEIVTIYQTEDDNFINSLALSSNGQIAFSLMHDNAEDIVVLKNGKLEFITKNHSATQPIWQTEQEILFISEQSGIDNLYSLDLATKELNQLSNSFGGVLKFSLAADKIVYHSVSGQGNDLFRLEPLNMPLSLKQKIVEIHEINQNNYPVEDYKPTNSLAPYGWLPDISVSNRPFGVRLKIGANIFGEDYSGKHSYLLKLGLAFAPVPADASFGIIRHYYSAHYNYYDGLNLVNISLDKLQRQALNYSIKYHREIPLGYYKLVISPSISGIIENSYPRLSIYSRFSGFWPNRTGFSIGVHSLSSYRNNILYTHILTSGGYFFPIDQDGLFGSMVTGFSLSSDFEKIELFNLYTSYYNNLKKLDLEGELGLRVSWQTDFAKANSLILNMDYDYRLPIKLRYDDALYALESIRINPSFSTAYNFTDSSMNFSSSLGLAADFMVFYSIPISYGINVPIYGSEYKFTIKTNFDLEPKY